MLTNFDILTKVYCKFYICQINSSVSFPTYIKVQQLEEKLINSFQEENNGIEIKDLMDIEDSNKNVITNDFITNSNNEKYFRKFFAYNGKIYSKVEIMGLVVQSKTILQGERERRILYIDDTTGVIQCILWKNKMENIYYKSEGEINTGTFMRILGQVDYFSGKFEINIENYQIITNYEIEKFFHQTLYKNLKAIENCKLDKNIDEEDIFINEKNNNNYEKDNNVIKDFTNSLLAFFQNYKIEGTTDDKFGFTKISVKKLIQNLQINQILNDYYGNKSKEDYLKILKNVFESILNQNMLGKIIYKNDNKVNFEESDVEIKIDISKLKKEIVNFIDKKTNEDSSIGASFQEICKYINQIYNNFYTNDYLKFIINQLIEIDKCIMGLTKNSYSTIKY
jgi:DNA/RNA endonuclease YhcR with UshA esterase domain